MAQGHFALIDAETLRPDLTGLPDLVTLAYLGQVDVSDNSSPASPSPDRWPLAPAEPGGQSPAACPFTPQLP